MAMETLGSDATNTFTVLDVAVTDADEQVVS